ncbi:NfeD family protein [Prosthecobacter sp.]|uniref:NfeD family protein n=1 Tax=Prosthecobacter sp. TaxID=1965333 RepID=UPI003782DED1
MLSSIAILTLFGVLLIMLETFLPGWVAGILGAISIFIALGLALMSDGLGGWSSGERLLLALGIVVFSVAALVAWLRWFAVKFFRRSLTLTTSIDTQPHAGAAPGAQGVALTELRPLGRAEIAGQRYEVRCQNGLAAAGARVEVIAAEPGNLLVRTL